MNKINIGCGANVVHGSDWLNIDNSLVAKLRKVPFWSFLVRVLVKYKFLEEFYLNYPNVKIVDIRKKLPFKDESFEYIYCSQVVEHLHIYQLNKFINECYRILKPGGIMRILTPDLKKIISLYNNSDCKKFELNDNLETSLIADHINLVFYPRSHISTNKRGVVQRFMDYIPEQHKYIYDFDSYAALSSSKEFSRVMEIETEDSSFPDVDTLDKYQDISLQLELVK